MILFLEGLAFYLLLCLITILCGKGIIRLLGLRMENQTSNYLAPAVTLAFWTVILGLGVTWGYSVKQLWKIGWVLTVLMALWGLKKDLFGIRQNGNKWLLLAVFLPMGLMFPYFGYGLKVYLGSHAPDGWSYIAYGQYLWEYPRGSEGGLAALYQYAAHLNATRFIASALLAFFSPFLQASGDTQMASGFFLAWSFFVFSSACLFFISTQKYSGFFIFLYLGLCGCSGWLLNLLWANNYDNALAISFLPTFAGVLFLIEPRDFRWTFLLALLSAGILYCYPEMAIFVLGATFLFWLQRFVMEKKRDWLILLLGACALAAVMIAPFFKNLVSFLQGQISISISSQGVRPGEGYFSELLTKEFGLLAFWGFRKGSTAGSLLHSFVGFLLSLLAIWGTLGLFRKKAWGLLGTILLLFVGSLLMIFHFRYSYGAYKFILLNWWGICFLTLEGMKQFHARVPSPKTRLAFFTLIILFFIIQGVTVFSWSDKRNDILPFKKVEEIKNILKGEAVIVAVGEDFANEWAVYFLRDIPIHLAEYRVYMAQSHVVPFMQRAKGVEPSKLRYALIDHQQVQIVRTGRLYSLVWSGGPYSLLKIDPGKSEAAFECLWLGFSSFDLVNLSESPGGDGQKDAVFALDINTSGKITSIALSNINGMHSLWDTIPNNGNVLLGVADAANPQILLNKPDGSVEIEVEHPKRLLLYAADNSSIKEGRTTFQLTIRLADSQLGTALVKRQ